MTSANVRDWVAVTAIVFVTAVFGYDHLVHRDVPTPTPAPAVDGVALGKAYAPKVVATYASTWDKAADQLGQGKSVAEIAKTFEDDWKAARTQAFHESVAPEFSKVLPEGNEPSDSRHRAEVVELWKGFASGLKGGAK